MNAKGSEKIRYDYFLKLNLQYFAGDSGEKTEAPTSKRKQQAREDGNVAKSKEIPTAALFILGFFGLRIFGGYMFTSITALATHAFTLLEGVDEIFNISYMSKLVAFVFSRIILICSPIFAIAFAVGIISNLIQVGWHPTTKPLKPKFNKFNPISGMKNILSMKSIVELFKSIFKVIIISSVIYFELKSESKNIMILINMGLEQALIYIMNIAINLGIKVGAWFVFLAAADFSYQKYSHYKKLKMSKQEVKDEYKMSEGDPKVKAKIKSKMREISMRRMMQDLPNADVIITNPTHYAVALKYDKEKSMAPYVVAKGADYVAKRIKDAAKEHQIEIVENKQLARALYSTVEVGQEVPPELYQAVAEILAFVYSLKNKQVV